MIELSFCTVAEATAAFTNCLPGLGVLEETVGCHQSRGRINRILTEYAELLSGKIIIIIIIIPMQILPSLRSSGISPDSIEPKLAALQA